MDKIALLIDKYCIYWSALIFVLAITVAVCMFLSLYIKSSKNILAGFATVPLAVFMSLVCARFVHWYSNTDSYYSFAYAMSHYFDGDFALIGAFAGCFFAATLTYSMKLHSNLAKMLDSMCLAGGAGITIGRLIPLFGSSDRGQIIESIHALPWTYPVINVVSGEIEYRLATFLLQAVITGTITIILTVFYLTRKHMQLKDGDTAFLFLLCYCAAQTVLDSTRYDSMYFRSNGFVSVVQVFSAMTLVYIAIVFSVRLVRKCGFRFYYIVLWLTMTVLLSSAGYMEYYVQRHGEQALLAYSVMSISLGAFVALTLIIRRHSQ